jgi:protein gp37
MAPASVKFVSFEPLIGPVRQVDLKGIDWVIDATIGVPADMTSMITSPNGSGLIGN